MYLPSIFSENFFDDWMDYSFPRVDVDKQLYGKNANRVMKTDVREHEDGYEVEIDLPGFKKDVFGLTHFGASAPAGVLDEKFGFKPELYAQWAVAKLK